VATASPAGLFTVGNGTLTVTGDGNVGIRTANPTAALDVNGAINASTVTASAYSVGGSAGWSGSYAVSEIDSYTKLLLHADGTDGSTTFTDSATGKTITAGGDAQIDTAQSKFGGASALFDGTGDYLSVADSDDWNFGTGNFTIDFWYKHNAVSATYPAIAEHGNGWVIINYNMHQSQYGITFSGAGFFLSTFAGAYYGGWHHIAFTRNGTPGTSFLDGVKMDEDTSADATAASTSPLYIGRWETSYTTTTNGWIDELRITKGIARWTGNFTPPAKDYSTKTVTVTNGIITGAE